MYQRLWSQDLLEHVREEPEDSSNGERCSIDSHFQRAGFIGSYLRKERCRRNEALRIQNLCWKWKASVSDSIDKVRKERAQLTSQLTSLPSTENTRSLILDLICFELILRFCQDSCRSVPPFIRWSHSRRIEPSCTKYCLTLQKMASQHFPLHIRMREEPGFDDLLKKYGLAASFHHGCVDRHHASIWSDEIGLTLLCSIFKHLPRRSILTASLVCKVWLEAARSDIVWNRFINKDFDAQTVNDCRGSTGRITRFWEYIHISTCIHGHSLGLPASTIYINRSVEPLALFRNNLWCKYNEYSLVVWNLDSLRRNASVSSALLATNTCSKPFTASVALICLGTKASPKKFHNAFVAGHLDGTGSLWYLDGSPEAVSLSFGHNFFVSEAAVTHISCTQEEPGMIATFCERKCVRLLKVSTTNIQVLRVIQIGLPLSSFSTGSNIIIALFRDKENLILCDLKRGDHTHNPIFSTRKNASTMHISNGRIAIINNDCTLKLISQNTDDIWKTDQDFALEDGFSYAASCIWTHVDPNCEMVDITVPGLSGFVCAIGKGNHGSVVCRNIDLRGKEPVQSAVIELNKLHTSWSTRSEGERSKICVLSNYRYLVATDGCTVTVLDFLPLELVKKPFGSQNMKPSHTSLRKSLNHYVWLCRIKRRWHYRYQNRMECGTWRHTIPRKKRWKKSAEMNLRNGPAFLLPSLKPQYVPPSRLRLPSRAEPT